MSTHGMENGIHRGHQREVYASRALTRLLAHRSGGASAGFTLAELMVTLAILLALLVLVIPNLTGVTMQANENAAMSSLKEIYQAEADYAAKYPTAGFTCTLSALGGPAQNPASSPKAAGLLANELASGRKSGYIFSIARCVHGMHGQPDQVTAFEVTAVPISLGRTGHLGYCLDQTDALRSDPTGGTNCTRSAE